MNERYRVLFVCLGNICRSPTAEAVMRAKLDAAGLAGRVAVESAGTGPWHVGKAPDARAAAAAAERGYSMQGMRGRQVAMDDFSEFDQILAMDSDNLRHLMAMRERRGSGPVPELFLDYSQRWSGDVPDPYYGDEAGFSAVFDRVEEAVDGLLRHIQQALGDPR